MNPFFSDYEATRRAPLLDFGLHLEGSFPKPQCLYVVLEPLKRPIRLKLPTRTEKFRDCGNTIESDGLACHNRIGDVPQHPGTAEEG
jgi:hypothetical protein